MTKTIKQQVEEIEAEIRMAMIAAKSNPKTPKAEYYTGALLMITEALQERDRIAREEERETCKKILSNLQYQNCLKKDGAVVTNTRNGGYSLDNHQQRMDDEFDKARQALTTPLTDK